MSACQLGLTYVPNTSRIDRKLLVALSGWVVAPRHRQTDGFNWDTNPSPGGGLQTLS